MQKYILLVACLCLSLAGVSADTNVAKYVFFFIGDGMGVNHVHGAEMWAGSQKGKIGVEPMLFTSFPYSGLSGCARTAEWIIHRPFIFPSKAFEGKQVFLMFV